MTCTLSGGLRLRPPAANPPYVPTFKYSRERQMVNRIRTILVFLVGVLIGGGLVWWHISKQHWNEKRWHQLIDAVKQQPSHIPRELNALLLQQKNFSSGSDECITQADRILKLNNVNASAPTLLGSNRIWERKTALFLTATDNLNDQFVFVCLLDSDMSAERTRLLFPAVIGGRETLDEWVAKIRMIDVEF